MLLSEGLDYGSELGEIVAGHRREEVMLELVLHTAEEVLRNGVIAADSSCSSELISGEAVR